MTPDDVTYAVNWEQANNYQLTLPFNGFYADPTDPLTQAFVANAASFRWLNHGFEHIYQGCVQNFTVVPWQCTLDPAGQTVWTVTTRHLQRDREQHHRRPFSRAELRPDRIPQR